MSATPTSSTTYIGIYVGSSSTAPSSASSYTWSKYVGSDGTPSYTFVRYSANADGTDFVSTPTASTKYVGIAVTSTNSAPSAKTSYTWSKYVGDDGEDALSLVITSSDHGEITWAPRGNHVGPQGKSRDRKSTRLNSSHRHTSRMPSSA